MAHELAHILGAPHDKTPKCPFSDGYLMSYFDGGTKKYRLSKCSEEEIRKNLQELPQSCFNEQSKTNYLDVYKRYPGQSVRPQHYCEMMLKVKGRRTKVFPEKPDILSRECKMNCCKQEQSENLCYKVIILEGMECTKGKTCRRGVCGYHKWP
ncbi:A disintegrin and metalloproteinase with thrombospondin motifs 20-like [Dermacentor silvarum]|uniref:A disintegrin and metalloproteinase with thrombospondin motifs 20-like n=1 Tax=Dermacentor silvarum TaxID=543639 RepID=UPI0021017040|nr:A disintegrin and metalloproteinase with thrombospondin motifs 20-like [Dermacentor silvarum]